MMNFMGFKFLNCNGKCAKKDILALYESIALAARDTRFYEDMAVPDTLDGRFELLSLLASMVMLQLKSLESDQESQMLFDVMFKNIDSSLREMGIGDLSVPRHMKRMMAGFNGRVHAYEQGIRETGRLDDALRKNLYGTVPDIDDAAVKKAEGFMKKLWTCMEKMSYDDIVYAPQSIETGVQNTLGEIE